MKLYRFSLLTIASIAAFSCVKEQLSDENFTPESNYVPMTFTAYTEGNDTKAAISAEEKDYTLSWKGTEDTPDKISVLSANTVNAEFSTKTTGTSADFGGKATEDEEKYYAVYPYTDGLTLTDATISGVKFPTEQAPTAGTFDPTAYVAVAESENTSFGFKTLGTLVRFQVGASFTGTVTVSGNANETVAGIGDVTFTDGIPSWKATSGNKTASMTGTFAENTEYYIVIAANDYAKGITVSYTVGENRYYETIGTDLAGAGKTTRNVVLNLRGSDLNKTLQSRVTVTGTPNDLYVAYLHGYDINVCDNAVVNKTNDPDAQLITKESSTTNLKEGVYFVDPDTECSIGTGISSLVVIGRIEGTRTPLTRDAVSYLDATTNTSDRLILKNVTDKVASSSNKYQLNKIETFESVIFDDCYFDIESEKALLAYANDGRKLDIFIMENCDCKINTKGYITSARNTPIQKIELQNNVIFGDTQAILHLVDYTGSNLPEITTINLDNNTLYNVVAPSAAQGYIRVKSITNLTVTDNLFYDCASDKNHSYVYNSNVTVTNPLASHNIDSENGTSPRVYIVNGTAPSGVTAPTITNYDFPLNSWNPSEGSYAIPGNYNSDYYGAIR